MIEPPYLLFLGDAPDMLAAKVAIGIRDWRPENTRGQLRLPGHALRSLAELRDMALLLAHIANPACQVVGISVNTQHMTEAGARACLAEVEAEMGLPATDPYRFGAQKLVDALAAM